MRTVDSLPVTDSVGRLLLLSAVLRTHLRTIVLGLLGRIIEIRLASDKFHSLSSLSSISNPSRIMSSSSSNTMRWSFMLMTHLLDSCYLAVVID